MTRALKADKSSRDGRARQSTLSAMMQGAPLKKDSFHYSQVASQWPALFCNNHNAVFGIIMGSYLSTTICIQICVMEMTFLFHMAHAHQVTVCCEHHSASLFTFLITFVMCFYHLSILQPNFLSNNI